MEIKEFDELRKKIEEAKAKKNRAEGSLAEAMARLLKEFGCKSLEEAEKKLASLQAEIDADEIKLEEMLRELDSAVEWSKL
jgi:predicted  nucleic acid-binding Zn-ribbon protein